MIPILIGLAAAAAGTAAYKYFFDEDAKPTAPYDAKRLGSFAIWGRPNVGKTTFVAGILGLNTPLSEKTATTSRTVYRDVKLDNLNGEAFLIDEIVDKLAL